MAKQHSSKGPELYLVPEFNPDIEIMETENKDDIFEIICVHTSKNVIRSSLSNE